MIVVVGSRHDAVATSLVASWRSSALCSAQDLVSQGWIWRDGKSSENRWIVNGKQVRDEEITGVFVRRSTVYPEELTTTHRDDRAFLASEIHAFLTFLLATTSALVVNPVCDGAFGEEALRPERWSSVALESNIAVRPLRVSTTLPRRPRYRMYEVEVVGKEAFGDAPLSVRKKALLLIDAIGLRWANLLFDLREQLVTITGTRRPSRAAAAALEKLLRGDRS